MNESVYCKMYCAVLRKVHPALYKCVEAENIILKFLDLVFLRTENVYILCLLFMKGKYNIYNYLQEGMLNVVRFNFFLLMCV